MQRYYSNIYWHFTGSPEIDWHKVTRPEDIVKFKEPLGDREAAGILTQILESHRLIASCTEQITEELQTLPFCSVTDIPLKDLISHSRYYGRVAIGFKAGSIHRSFVPVMYISRENRLFIEKVFEHPHLRDLAGRKTEPYPKPADWADGVKSWTAPGPGPQAWEVDSSQIAGFLMNFVKVTGYATKESDSFYREREWRHLGDYVFQPADVAAILVPGGLINELKETMDRQGYTTDISILSWEFVENA